VLPFADASGESRFVSDIIFVAVLLHAPFQQQASMDGINRLIDGELMCALMCRMTSSNLNLSDLDESDRLARARVSFRLTASTNQSSKLVERHKLHNTSYKIKSHTAAVVSISIHSIATHFRLSLSAMVVCIVQQS
jgi:hypothetical protein